MCVSFKIIVYIVPCGKISWKKRALFGNVWACQTPRKNCILRRSGAIGSAKLPSVAHNMWCLQNNIIYNMLWNFLFCAKTNLPKYYTNNARHVKQIIVEFTTYFSFLKNHQFLLSFALQRCHNFAHFACFEHGKAICVEAFPQHIVYYVANIAYNHGQPNTPQHPKGRTKVRLFFLQQKSTTAWVMLWFCVGLQPSFRTNQAVF